MGPVSEPLYLNIANSSQNEESEPNIQPNPSHKSPLKCPRCTSTNTKFCYYNNYSRLQPRHYCRACRRHWTAGGTLRDVPFGGGRKYTKRRKMSENYNNTPGTASSTETFNETNLPLHNFPFGDTMFLPSGPFLGNDAESAYAPMYEGVGPTWQLPETMPAGYWDEITDLI